jgi:hypothetical protein
MNIQHKHYTRNVRQYKIMLYFFYRIFVGIYAKITFSFFKNFKVRITVRLKVRA